MSVVLTDVGTVNRLHSANHGRFNILSFGCQELQKNINSRHEIVNRPVNVAPNKNDIQVSVITYFLPVLFSFVRMTIESSVFV